MEWPLQTLLVEFCQFNKGNFHRPFCLCFNKYILIAFLPKKCNFHRHRRHRRYTRHCQLKASESLKLTLLFRVGKYFGCKRASLVCFGWIPFLCSSFVLSTTNEAQNQLPSFDFPTFFFPFPTGLAHPMPRERFQNSFQSVTCEPKWHFYWPFRIGNSVRAGRPSNLGMAIEFGWCRV